MLKFFSTFFLFLTFFSWEGDASNSTPSNNIVAGKLTLKGRVRGKCYVEVSSNEIQLTPGEPKSFTITGNCEKKKLTISIHKNFSYGTILTPIPFNLKLVNKKNGKVLTHTGDHVYIFEHVKASDDGSWDIEGKIDIPFITNGIPYGRYSCPLYAEIES